MKINQVSRAENGQDKFNRILAFILSSYPFFQVAEFSLETFSYDTYPQKPDVGDNRGSRRSINGDLKNFVYSPSKGGATQKAYGYEYVVDRAYTEDLNVGKTPDGLRRELEREQIRLAKQVVDDIIYDMINGDGNDQILGLATLIKDAADSSGQAEAFGLTKAQIHTSLKQMNVTLDVTDKALLRSFEEELIKVFTKMSTNAVLVMNESVYPRMSSVAKELSAYTETKSDFSKPISQIDGRKMVPVPDVALPQTESDTIDGKSSSIYIIDFNETDGFRYATNSGFFFKDFENIEEKPSGKSRFEFIGNSKLENVKSIKRLSRIRI